MFQNPNLIQNLQYSKQVCTHPLITIPNPFKQHHTHYSYLLVGGGPCSTWVVFHWNLSCSKFLRPVSTLIVSEKCSVALKCPYFCQSSTVVRGLPFQHRLTKEHKDSTSFCFTFHSKDQLGTAWMSC